MPRYIRQDGQAVPISDLPYPIDASGVSFTDSGLTVITGVSDVQAALEAADAALDDRPTQQEIEDFVVDEVDGRFIGSFKRTSQSNVFASETVTDSFDVDLPADRLIKVTLSVSVSASGGSGDRRVRGRLREGTDTSGTVRAARTIHYLRNDNSPQFTGGGTAVDFFESGLGGVTDFVVTLDSQGEGARFHDADDQTPVVVLFEDLGPAPS